MSWCPKCRVEYREGFTICGDCGANLVDQLPPLAVPKNPEIRFDTESFLMTAYDEAQASVIESLLRSYDIPTARNYREAGGVVRVFTGKAIWGIDICVPSRKLKAAQKIVKANLRQQAGTMEGKDKPRISRKRYQADQRVARRVMLIAFIIIAIVSLFFSLYAKNG